MATHCTLRIERCILSIPPSSSAVIYTFNTLHCKILQNTATHCHHPPSFRSKLNIQHTALQHNAPSVVIYTFNTLHCTTLQNTATHSHHPLSFRGNLHIQHAATHCNTLQNTATHCNTLQHTAEHCNTLQHTAIIPPPSAVIYIFYT